MMSKIKTATKILDESASHTLDIQQEVARQRLNLECSQLIYKLRKNAGMSQKDLATLVGTSQSAIARLENSDYDGRTLTMMMKIASSLGFRLELNLIQNDSEIPSTVDVRAKQTPASA